MSNTNENQSVAKTNINWYPGHMAKTKRELSNMISNIDYVIEVIDARCLISSRMKDMDNIIGNLPKILVVTKYDLCDQEASNKILESLKEDFIIFNKDSPSINNLIDQKARKLCKDKLIKRENKGILNTKLKGLIIGIPNVGKSTVINNIIGRKSLEVGNKPGVTKSIRPLARKEGEIYDVPGLLWPKFSSSKEAYNLSLISAINENIIPLDEVINYLIKFMINNYPKLLKERYSLSEIDIDTIYDEIAYNKSLMIKGGLPDYDRVLKTIFQDFKNGRLGNITLEK